MSQKFRQGYKPTAADHTRTPDLSNLAAFNVAVSKGGLAQRYDLTKLSSTYTNTNVGGEEGGGEDIAERDRGMTSLIKGMLQAANNALDRGGCALSDAKMATHLAQQTLWARGEQASEPIGNWLDQEIPTADQAYLHTESYIPDWDESLVLVDNAVAEGEITADDADRIKQSYDHACETFGSTVEGAPQSDRTHMAVLREFQNSVREINNGVIKAGGKKVMPSRDRVARCEPDSESDLSSDSGSDSGSSSGSSSSSGSDSGSDSGSSSDDSNLDSTLSEKKRRKRMLSHVHDLGMLLKRALDQWKPAILQVLPRQLTPISVSTPGATQSTGSKTSTSATSTSATSTSATSTSATSTSATSISSAPPSSTRATSSSSLSTSKQATSTSSTKTSTGYDLAVTTIFTPPPECSSGLTEIEAATGIIWRNVINPVPSLTLTSCFPSQFYASALATTSLPQFNQLVCPYGWESYNITTTYLICCPRGFGFYAPNFNNTQRPGLGAICTSTVWADVLMDITSYDTTALATIIPTSAGINGTLVFATAFDGISATAVVTSPTSSSASSSSTSKSTTASTTTSIITSTTTSRPTSSTMSTSTKPLSSTTSTSTKPVSSTTSSSTTKSASSSTKSSLTTKSTTTASATSKPTSSLKPTTSTSSPTTKSATTTSASGPSISQLPACGQTCFNNLLGQYSTLGCGTPDPACLCRNVNFGYGIRDCANGACGTDVASTVIAFESTYCASATSARTTLPTTASATTTGIGALPSCGQTCFNNLLAQYSTLGCGTPDPACLCRNVNFGYGIRDCANGACGTAVASTVIAFESTYCASATSARTTYPATASATTTGIASLPSCGQTCFNNMLAQYSSLGCTSPDPACLCKNVNFGYGIRDCSNGACGTAIASTVIAFESSYCASATAAPKI
ncbi:hypothetical protein TrVGV298_010604 [Trichoderma virens]|nr:hypothetical protein TrVGV298_010604 [Trichoderma virens]